MADYRDDREALHERVTTLQQELDGARTDLERERAKGTKDERVEALAGELRATQQNLARMEAELRALRGPNAAAVAPKSRRGLAVAGSAAVLGVIGVMMLSGSRSRPPPPPPPPPLVTAAPAAPIPVVALVTASTALAVPAPPEAPARTVKATWPARVRLATGTPVAVGSTCTIEANIGAEHGALPSLHDVALRCGERVVYDSSKASFGMRQSGSSVGQFPARTRGSVVFDVSYSDTGTGDSPQIRIDPDKGTVFVWHDYPDAFRLELTYARASSPVATEPLGTLARAALDRTARVQEVRGRAAPAVGTMCTVHAMPAAARSCYVSVDCGAGAALFGVAPFSATATCNANDVVAGKARILDLDDPNGSTELAVGGDPRLHLFTPPGPPTTPSARDVLTVADEPKNGNPWSVELVLAEPSTDDAGAK